MELTGVPMPKMDWASSNLPEAWTQFQEHTALIFAGPLRDREESEKCTYLLLWIGQKGREIHKSWNLTVEQNKKLDVLYKKFLEYVQPKLNSVFKRYQFNNMVQGDLSIEDFTAKLKIAAKDCKFPNTDEMIRDRLVFGVSSSKIREKLITKAIV
jgi:hypothetical protein